MSKSKKQNKKEKHNKTIKHKKIILPTENKGYGLISNSYSPTINKELVTLNSVPRKELLDCNMEAAYKVKKNNSSDSKSIELLD